MNISGKMVVFARILQKDRGSRAWIHGEIYFKVLARLIVGAVKNLQTRPESLGLGRVDIHLPLTVSWVREVYPHYGVYFSSADLKANLI